VVEFLRYEVREGPGSAADTPPETRFPISERSRPVKGGFVFRNFWYGKNAGGTLKGVCYLVPMVGFTQPFFITPCDGRKLR
jgi:hypothetical protein